MVVAAALRFANQRTVVPALAVGAAGLAMALTGCTATVTGHPVAGGPTGTAAAPEVSIFAMERLLLSPADVDTAAHTSGMQVVKGPLTKMWDDSAVVDNLRCLGTWSPAQAKVYAGSDWSVVRGEILKDGSASGDDAEHSVVQMVVHFPKADTAQAFLSRSASAWSECENTTIAATASVGRKQPWTLGDFTHTDDTLTMTQRKTDGHGECQRALSVHSNVAIDVMMCGADVTDQAKDIAAAIADGMPRV
jgi:PknH-like extracellular domain